MSHELRTPMNAILGFAQLLLTEDAAADPPGARQRLQRIHDAGVHLLALIDDVLDLSSLESGDRPLRLQPLALDTVLADTLAQQADAARARQVALSAPSPTGLQVLADATRLRQALGQLLANAVKFNRDGGAVRLWAEPAGAQVRIVVEDTGSGLDRAQLAHLFEPFNRLGREHEGIAGTGIGLAIAHAAVRQMGGRIEATSRPGEGSRFMLLLPRADASPAQATGPDEPAGPPPRAGAPDGTVLYIEDNEVNQLIVREMLHRRPGVTCLSAHNGLDGLALARRHRPALILLDMQLPDIDGHEVLARLRDDPQTAGIRCVAVSANAMPEDIRRALDAGCAAYWTKPLDLRAFLGALDDLFGAASAGPAEGG